MITKTCTKCKTEKSENDFRFANKAKGYRVPWCKPCYSTYEREAWKKNPKRRKEHSSNMTARRTRNKEFVWTYLLSHPCVECGASDPRVLQFNHLDRSLKFKAVANLIQGQASLKKLQAEIDKCEVLCANCHLIHTYEQLGWWTGNGLDGET